MNPSDPLHESSSFSVLFVQSMTLRSTKQLIAQQFLWFWSFGSKILSNLNYLISVSCLWIVAKFLLLRCIYCPGVCMNLVWNNLLPTINYNNEKFSCYRNVCACYESSNPNTEHSWQVCINLFSSRNAWTCKKTLFNVVHVIKYATLIPEHS
jgi:hypothetical protein